MTSPSRVLGAAGILLVFSAAAPAWAAGDFFSSIGEALFGRPPQLAPEPTGGDPLSVTVRPRRAVKRAKSNAPNLRRSAGKPKPEVVKLDPVADPYWYLKDPTLRRGDIIVLQGRVIVFAGRPDTEHGPEDFERLTDTRLVSPKTQKLLVEMAAGHKLPDAPASLRPAAPTRTSEAR